MRCRKIGFVRSEHVVRGGEAMVAFACGACGYSWQRPEDSEEARQALAPAKPAATRTAAAKAANPATAKATTVKATTTKAATTKAAVTKAAVTKAAAAKPSRPKVPLRRKG